MRNLKRLETPEPLTMNEVKQAVIDLLTPGKRPALVYPPRDNRALYRELGYETDTLQEQFAKHAARMNRLTIKDE
jgi:hypothetical protein